MVVDRVTDEVTSTSHKKKDVLLKEYRRENMYHKENESYERKVGDETGRLQISSKS